jgi:hypothetical protein
VSAPQDDPAGPSDTLPGLLVAFLLGGLLGYALRWGAEPPAAEPRVQVVETQTVVEVPYEDTNRLESAQAELAETRHQLTDKDAQLRRLRLDKASSEEVERVRMELAELRVRHAELRRARDERVAEFETSLREVGEDRDRALVELRSLQELNAETLWDAFVANAKTRVCDRGTKARHVRCYEAVEAGLREHRDRFEDCLGSTQRVPTLVRHARPREPVPAKGKRLRDAREFSTHGWYVLYCDVRAQPSDTGRR